MRKVTSRVAVAFAFVAGCSSSPSTHGSADGGSGGGSSGGSGGGNDPFVGTFKVDPGSTRAWTCPGMADSSADLAGNSVIINALSGSKIQFSVPGSACTYDLTASGSTADILPAQGCTSLTTPAGASSETRDAMVLSIGDGGTLSYTASSTFGNGCTAKVTATLTRQ